VESRFESVHKGNGAGAIDGDREQLGVSKAVKRFLADCESRGLTAATLEKYRRLLEGEFLELRKDRNAAIFDRMTVDLLRKFRKSMEHSLVTQ
jgi:hypothetical protein